MTTRPFPITRRATFGLVGAALVLPREALAGSVSALSGEAFATTWRIIAPADSDLSSLRPQIEGLFARIDRGFSPWRRDSDISRFNASAAGWHAAEPDLVTVTRAALAIAAATEGAFDPTVGPLVAGLGFGPIARGGLRDWRGIGAEGSRLGKTRADLTLDLCGIAKGWALDRAAELVAGRGVGDFLFELGGEFASLGRHPDGRDWRVAVESPAPGEPLFAALRLPAGSAVATSGTRAQGFTLGDRIYSHIVAPDHAAPRARHHSVTVVAADTTAADGWATALCAAGPDLGPQIARDHDITALFLTETGDEPHRTMTGDMRAMLL